MVVQASNAGSRIRTPLLAVSAYHESLADLSNSSIHQAFAQRKYLDTIQYVTRLQEGSEEISTGELLALSLILRTLETFRNDDNAAAVHLQASRSILEQTGTQDLESSWVRPVLLPMLYRLEYRSLSSSVLSNGDITTENGGVERAREKGHAIMSWFCHNLARSRSSATLKPFRSQAYQTLRNFYSEVDEVSRNKETRGLPMKDILYVKIQWLLVKLTLSTLVFKDEKRNDKATDDFQTLLTLCEECARATRQVNGNSQNDAPSSTPVRLSLGMELVATVFLVATWCRDPQVRSKALRFFNSSPRRETRWYSWHAAAILEWVISKETCGQDVRSAADVLTTRRIYIEQIEYFHDIQDSALPLSASRRPFRSPSWAQVRYTHLLNPSERLSAWVHLDEPDFTPSQPRMFEKAGPKDDVVLSFKVTDPIMPSTAALLLLSYKRSSSLAGDSREVDMFTCDAASSQDTIGTVNQAPKRCVLDENLFTHEDKTSGSLCSLRKLDPSKQGL